jgi:hypothetical protein
MWGCSNDSGNPEKAQLEDERLITMFKMTFAWQMIICQVKVTPDRMPTTVYRS